MKAWENARKRAEKESMKNRLKPSNMYSYMYKFYKTLYPQGQYIFLHQSDVELFKKYIKKTNNPWWLLSTKYNPETFSFTDEFKGYVTPENKICDLVSQPAKNIEFRPAVIVRKYNLLKVGQSIKIDNYTYTVVYRTCREYCALCDCTFKNQNLINYKKINSEDIAKELKLLPK